LSFSCILYFCSFIFFCFFFVFFQAEDGIRDFHVTGVQTCALPIWDTPKITLGCDFHLSYENLQDAFVNPSRYVIGKTHYLLVERSEERRVGKECRSGGGAYY